MTVDFMYKVVLFTLNKNQGQGNLKPDDFNNSANLAQYDFLNYLLGIFQQYQGGRPVATVQFGMNESVRQRLTPFIKPVVPLTPDTTGFAAYPSDYQQGDAMYDSAMNRIRYVQQHKLYSYLYSTIDPINSNPIFLIESGGFRFYPNMTWNNTASPNAFLSYVSTPANITWGYILDPNGIPVYNPGTSSDPEWYDVDCEQIIDRILRRCGVNLNAGQVSQYAQELKLQGS